MPVQAAMSKARMMVAGISGVGADAACRDRQGGDEGELDEDVLDPGRGRPRDDERHG